MRSLLIGGDGLIGTELRTQLLAKQVEDGMLFQTFWTSRKYFYETGASFLDLANTRFTNVTAWPITSDVDVVFIVAAMTKAFECEKQPILSYRVNVDAPIYIAEHCKNAFIVYLSSEAAMYAQSMEYGRQKALAEIGILAMHGYRNTAIVRPAKITQDNVKEFCEKLIRIAVDRRYGITML